MDNEESKRNSKGESKDREIMRKSSTLSFVAVVLFLGLSYITLKDIPSPHQAQLAALDIKRATLISLDLFQDKEAKTVLDHVPVAGEVLSFRVSVNKPIHAALLASSDLEHPLVLLEDERIPPGRNLVLKGGNTQYTYQIAQNTEHMTFCLLYADDRSQLLKKINQSNRETMAQQQDGCVHW